jgi:hypothetical protein
MQKIPIARLLRTFGSTQFERKKIAWQAIFWGFTREARQTPRHEVTEMEFLKNNVGNIVVGLIVFAALIFLVARLILNIRKGKTGCGCGCGSCQNTGF